MAYSDKEYIKSLFRTILHREPRDERELVFHADSLKYKSRQDKKTEFLVCPEKLKMDSHSISPLVFKRQPTAPVMRNHPRIAILLCGHFRNFSQTREHWEIFRKKYPTIDFYIHTWDSLGIRTADTWISKSGGRPDFHTIFKLFMPVSYLVETQTEELLDSFSLKGDYRMFYCEPSALCHHDDFSRYIVSQLYSIYQAHSMMEKTGRKYDIVYKVRADSYFQHFDYPLESPIPENVLYAYKHQNHIHVGGGGGCLMCDTEFSKVRTHTEHSNDICDVVVYGCMKVMKKYCELYLHVKDLYRGFKKYNEEMCVRYPHVIVEHDNNVLVKSPWYDVHPSIRCIYPERLIKEYMISEWICSDPCNLVIQICK